jgi:hypothetical protein
MVATPTRHLSQNVVDWGADPTGTRPCASSFQRALNASFGGEKWLFGGAREGQNFFSQDGDGRRIVPVHVPTGTYLIEKTIFIEGVHGGLLFGDGPYQSILKWVGPKPGGTLNNRGFVTPGVLTNMFLTNGWGRAEIRDLQFDMQSGPGSDGTVIFNWNWDGGNSLSGGKNDRLDANTTQFRLRRVFFRNATYGFVGGPETGFLGANSRTLPPNFGSGTQSSGNEADTATFLACLFDNLSGWNLKPLAMASMEAHSRTARPGSGAVWPLPQ